MGILENSYKTIENTFQPLVDFLEKNKENEKYKNKYKGITTLLSPVQYKPDILFLGINPGPGAYREQNKDQNTNITPLKMLGKDEEHFFKLDWFKRNTSRGRVTNGKWESYEWFQRDKPINNIFPARMIDILYNFYEYKYPDMIVHNDKVPMWAQEVEDKIVVTNLYPIVTDNKKILFDIFNALLKEESLKGFFHDYKIKHRWDLQLFFIKNYIDKLVSILEAKVIVCMRHSVYKDFTYTQSTHLSQVISSVKKINTKDYTVIGFSRKGNWSALIEEISMQIYKNIIESS